MSAEQATAPPNETATADGPPPLEDQIVEVLKTIYDPEIPVNIYELGLIYDVAVEGDHAEVKMTLTSPACPVAGSLPGEVEDRIRGVHGIESATVEVVWDPVWNPGMMSEAARLELGMM
jgi:FeS assembly SUF system protein